MIADTSALIAIIFREPDAATLLAAIRQSNHVRLSAVSFVEASLVLMRRRTPGGQALLEYLIRDFKIEIVPVTREHAVLAQQAFRQYGKGRHPAGLNLGDCFSYALAKHTGEPLLFKGDDFTQTDLTPA